MKRLVINGPTGVIGLALINQCLEKNIEVLAICRKGSKGIDKIPKSKYVKVVECDLSDLSSFNYDSKYEVFYHFAWEGTIGAGRNDMYLQNRNVKYTLDAVHLADRLGCTKFIGAGSQAEYGRVNGDIYPTTPTLPENGYGVAKLCAGQMSRILCQQMHMEHIWTRIFSVYGPNDDEQTMIMSTINKLLKGIVPQFTKGEQMWDYLFSEDAANALYLLGINGIGGKVYCLGSGQTKPLYEYIYEIRNQIDPNFQIELGGIPYSNNQVMYLRANIDDLKKDVGFVPSIDFTNGTSRIIQSLL
ncbi:NAD-dependent epimerase/dehydratase family protein [Lysinibacillus sp. NPDC097214]|uniref:NAD-dependent epimerase/dehydratase family protein n=1 Tax=Lysinibacillus sp. NPDC097214 TaxID=3390584 RepID=UPI003D083926